MPYQINALKVGARNFDSVLLRRKCKGTSMHSEKVVSCWIPAIFFSPNSRFFLFFSDL